MGYAFFRKIIFVFALLLLSLKGISQPYVDIINTSAQSLQSNYKDALKSKNITTNYFLNLTAPIRVDSQNTIIVRFYGENLRSTIKNDFFSQTNNLYAVLLPIGLQHETRNKKWKILGLVMPKLSSDFKDKISNYDMQLGGYGLLTYKYSDKLQIKAGLYYNREYFGNFFMPLAGIDWKINDRFQMYGVLPTFYRFEFATIKKKLYTGFEFRSYTRSYRLDAAENHNYVKNKEIKAKVFVDFYLTKSFILFAEFGRTIGYSPQEYLYGTKILAGTNPIYTGIMDGFLFNAGLAYRIRFDFK
ncbi:MAG: DUF6268 family outer membrane beta-barrel protein [Bacteroidia bacterium]